MLKASSSQVHQRSGSECKECTSCCFQKALRGNRREAEEKQADVGNFTNLCSRAVGAQSRWSHDGRKVDNTPQTCPTQGSKSPISQLPWVHEFTVCLGSSAPAILHQSSVGAGPRGPQTGKCECFCDTSSACGFGGSLGHDGTESPAGRVFLGTSWEPSTGPTGSGCCASTDFRVPSRGRGASALIISDVTIHKKPNEIRSCGRGQEGELRATPAHQAGSAGTGNPAQLWS